MHALAILATAPPPWHGYLAWAILGLGFASALVILGDELRPGNRQHMWIMNIVYPVTALYWGPAWVWAYFARGRRMSKKEIHRSVERLAAEGADPEELRRKAESTAKPDLSPWHLANAVSHCGAGCTLGDILGEWVIFETGILWFGTWSGTRLPEEMLIDFLAAWTLGVLFQYFTIVPMGTVGPVKGIWTAIKVDTASIVAFQVGLFGWMAIYQLVLWPNGAIKVDSSDYWFQMQIGMMLGFFTTWPVNLWLIRHRVKEKMDYRRAVAHMLEHRVRTA
jgi:hypothetical protein